MKKFIKSSVVFILLLILGGELIIRVNHVMSDIPQREINEFGIQKYIPNQLGYWKGGEHQWLINRLGWPGQLPKSYNNLVTIIGDSFIENFMNPNECHQSVLLKQKVDDFNFIEAGRSGVSFIEAMEISKQLDSLNPEYHLIYVSKQDFIESVADIEPLNDITQVNLKANKIEYGVMKSPSLKKVLYNFKLLYYCYTNFSLQFPTSKNVEKQEKITKNNQFVKNRKEILQLVTYVKSNYKINNKVLIFHPKTEFKIIEICQNLGFKTMILNSDNDKSWTFKHDHHWTCYGHNRVAEQVASFLQNEVIH